MKTHWLKERRKELRLSQEDLAAMLQLAGIDVVPSTISHWENGRYILPIDNPEFRRALSKALRMSVQDILIAQGYELQNDHSDEGERAAYIIDQLSPDKRGLALGILEQFLERA